MTAGESSDDGDLIQFWLPEYEAYYLYEGDEDYPYGWYNTTTDESFDTDYPNGKPVGTAFWYIARGAFDGTTGSITFAK